MDELSRLTTENLVARLTDLTTTGLARFQVVRELARRNEPKSVEALLAATKDSDLAVSYAAVEALGKVGNPQVIQPLIELVNHNVHAIAVVKALGSLGERQATLPLIEILGKVSGTLRLEIIKALGNLKDTRAIEPLTLLLKSPDLKVCRAAAEALATLKPLGEDKENI